MNFELVNDPYYPKLTSRLAEIVPEFKPVFDKEDGTYTMLYEFSQFIIDNIGDDVVLSKCTAFINEALRLGTHDTEDAIIIQVFEILAEDNSIYEIFKIGLSDKALATFTNVKAGL